MYERHILVLEGLHCVVIIIKNISMHPVDSVYLCIHQPQKSQDSYKSIVIHSQHQKNKTTCLFNLLPYLNISLICKLEYAKLLGDIQACHRKVTKSTSSFRSKVVFLDLLKGATQKKKRKPMLDFGRIKIEERKLIPQSCSTNFVRQSLLIL